MEFDRDRGRGEFCRINGLFGYEHDSFDMCVTGRSGSMFTSFHSSSLIMVYMLDMHERNSHEERSRALEKFTFLLLVRQEHRYFQAERSIQALCGLDQSSNPTSIVV